MPFSPALPYATRRSPVAARNAVATSHPLATQAGIAMLMRGGNAVDAALAAAITLTVVEPTGNGLGSDAFAILWDGGRLHGLNASGRAPRAWTPDRFAGLDRIPARGWNSVSVPGAVSAWVALSDRFGRLPFADLFGPAIAAAADGFVVSPIVAMLWAKGADVLKDQPGFADAFLPGGAAPRAGSLFRNPALAESLRLVAETKGRAFYEGALAERMAADAARHGAALTVEDLAGHTPEWIAPMAQTLRTPGSALGDSATLHEIPPNGQGIAALIALGLLDRCDLGTLGDPDGVDSLHLQIEAMKLALADTYAHVGDLGTMAGPAEALLDPAYLDRRAALIDRKAAGDPGAGAPPFSGTVCLAAADADGRMVSYIQSNYEGFGSGVVVPETGISLQNRGSAFTLAPGHANRVGPGKRPFHTIIPGFVTDDTGAAMAFGLMGGPMQAQGHVQMVLRTRLWGQNPQAAADAPRWRVLGGRTVAVEPSLPDATLQGLADRGHILKTTTAETDFSFGGAQLIHRLPEGGFIAGSDGRKDGMAAGF